MTSRVKCPGRPGRPEEKCGSKDLEVFQRLCHHSAFNGYRYTPSRYSAVSCKTCGWRWRTKANVEHLPDEAQS